MLDRLFDDVMNGVGGTALGNAAAREAFSPAIDVRANDDEVVFICDVPGLKHEDLDVTIEGSTLTIKGQRQYTGGEKDQVWLGRSYGAFEKAYTLPDLVDAEKMSAELSDGVLTIRVPKKPQAKPRRIAIGGGGGAKQLSENSEKK
jgi:HSP20 family protein